MATTSWTPFHVGGRAKNVCGQPCDQVLLEWEANPPSLLPHYAARQKLGCIGGGEFFQCLVTGGRNSIKSHYFSIGLKLAICANVWTEHSLSLVKCLLLWCLSKKSFSICKESLERKTGRASLSLETHCMWNCWQWTLGHHARSQRLALSLLQCCTALAFHSNRKG